MVTSIPYYCPSYVILVLKLEIDVGRVAFAVDSRVSGAGDAVKESRDLRLFQYSACIQKQTSISEFHILSKNFTCFSNIKFMSDGSKLYIVISLDSLFLAFQFNCINIHRSFVHSVVNINYLMDLEHEKQEKKILELMYLTIFHDDQPHSNANVKEQTLGLQLYCELIIESDTLYMLTAVGV